MHTTIRETQDRSHTARLLALLAQAPEGDKLGEIAWTLERLADPRSLAPLTALLEDTAAPERARQAAGGVLRSTGWTAPPIARRVWWRSGDPILERHALLLMDRADAEIVASVAMDPQHRHHRESIDALAFDFSEARFQELKIRALAHPDPRIRETACDTLLWDEPTAAESPLLLATADRDDRVAIAAINTLQYYSSTRVLRVLGELRGSPRLALREKAEESFNAVQGSFSGALERLDGEARRRLESWLEPFWSLVAYEAPPPDSEAGQTTRPQAPPPTLPPRIKVPEVEKMLADLDGLWATKIEQLRELSRAHHDPYDHDERRRLTALLLPHEDPEVRVIACSLLGAWGDQDALITLMDDPMFHVRKTATYCLGQIKLRTAKAAARCWQEVHEPATAGTHSYEALQAYASHAPRHEAVPRLLHLARHDERPVVQREAISQLVLHEARDEIASLLDLLATSPICTWSTHIELLSAAIDLEIPLDPPRSLLDADEVWVQSALARRG